MAERWSPTVTLWHERSTWGAASPNWSASILKTPVDNAWLHHTAGSVDSSVLAIQREHLARHNKNKKLNFQDIAYNALADQRGRSFVGRGLTAVHGNTDGNNSFTTCAIGNFENVEPSEDLLNALAWQIVDVWLRGIVKHPRWSGGHRDLMATACPGSKLHRKIPEINRRAQKIVVDVMAMIFAPDNPDPVTVITTEEDMFVVEVPNPVHGTKYYIVDPPNKSYTEVNPSWAESGMNRYRHEGWMHVFARLGYKAK